MFLRMLAMFHMLAAACKVAQGVAEQLATVVTAEKEEQSLTTVLLARAAPAAVVAAVIVEVKQFTTTATTGSIKRSAPAVAVVALEFSVLAQMGTLVPQGGRVTTILLLPFPVAVPAAVGVQAELLDFTAAQATHTTIPHAASAREVHGGGDFGGGGPRGGLSRTFFYDEGLQEWTVVYEMIGDGGTGGVGAVRIIWGTGRSYPSAAANV